MTGGEKESLSGAFGRSILAIFVLSGLFLPTCRTTLTIKPTEHSQVIEFLKEHRLSTQNLFFPHPEERSTFTTLPHLRLVDEKGNLYFEKTGYSPDAANEMLKAAQRREVLGQIAFPRLVTIDGQDVSVKDLPKAEFYILEDWATWCSPCPELMKQLEEMLAQQPPGRFIAIKICQDLFENDRRFPSKKSPQVY